MGIQKLNEINWGKYSTTLIPIHDQTNFLRFNYVRIDQVRINGALIEGSGLTVITA